MRMVRYRAENNTHIGVIVDDFVHPIQEYDDITALLTADPASRDAVLERAKDTTDRVLLSDIELLSPIPAPPKYLAVGLNSPAHLAEAATGPTTDARRARANTNRLLKEAYPKPRWPQLFNKQTSSVQDPFGPIWMPFDSATLDYEGEVALVIGQRIRRASEDEARSAIAGYMVANDVSIREWQFETSQIWLGKSFETHGPLGPWITTPDSVDESTLRIRTWVNGELRQDGQFGDQVVGPARIVAMCSHVCTLEPGDVIATGTPAGVGATTENWLRIGDVVRIEVDGLGAIENTVVAEPAS